MKYFLPVFVLVVTAFFSIQQHTFAQESNTGSLTPTLYCLGGVPCTAPTTPPKEAIPTPLTETTTSPETRPCGTTQSSVLAAAVKNEKRQASNKGKTSGSGGFFKAFFDFLLKLIELILQKLGGQTPGTPSTDPSITATPTPCPEPTAAAQPTTEAQPTAQAQPSTNPDPTSSIPLQPTSSANTPCVENQTTTQSVNDTSTLADGASFFQRIIELLIKLIEAIFRLFGITPPGSSTPTNPQPTQPAPVSDPNPTANPDPGNTTPTLAPCPNPTATTAQPTSAQNLVQPTTPPVAAPGVNGSLRVSDNGHYLVTAEGAPFFWMADTGWGLFSNLSPAEMDEYLQTRKSQGYTVIQAVLAFKHNGNPKGLPYNGNVGSINEAFFAGQVDHGVKKAKELGLILAIWPIWSDGQAGTNVNAGNAESYGRYLGNRYKNENNLVWVFGGDDGNRHPEIWRPMAKGIAIGKSGTEDYSKVLMSYHPRGDQTSSDTFHNDAWLDFNMVQSGHCPTNPLPYDLVGADYTKQPAKPVVDGEPMYEEHPYCWDKPPEGNSTALDVRKMAYWDVFSGGFGHTYGDHIVWAFINGRHPFSSWGGGTDGNWRDAINAEGGSQMQYVRKLMESRPFQTGVPDQSIITSGAGGGMDRKQATRASDGSYLMVYSPNGGFSANLTKLSGNAVKAYWYDPRNGNSTEIPNVQKGGAVQFNPPAGGDWVLVADDAGRNFKKPGS